MTTTLRLARARRALIAASVVRTLLLGTLVALGVLALLIVADTVFGLALGLRAAVALAPWLAGLMVIVAKLAMPARAGLKATSEDVALWFERRLPGLHYALVTQVGLGASTSPALERQIASAPLEETLAHGVRAALARPFAAVVVVTLLTMFIPHGAVGRVLAPAPGDALGRAGASTRAERDPLATIVVRVVPPPYTGLASVAHDDPATVSALAGSGVRIEGLGGAVRAISGADTSHSVSAASGGGWTITSAFGSTPRALRLRSASSERVLVLDPIADSLPMVVLDGPARDTVMRTAQGTVSLGADATDDLGLARAHFEFIISAGSGETFTFRSGAAGVRRFEPGTKRARLTAEIALDTIGLGPGDLIHLRAVAEDRNDVTGPGRGVSETRTIRIARTDEYDSVSVEPAPPPALDTAALSQRMILILTEELHAREPRMSRAEVSRESRRIAVDQTKLRKRVGEVVFQRLGEDNAGEHSHFAGDGHSHGEEGPLDPDQILAAAERASNVDPSQDLDHQTDETPVVAINRVLLEAYNHMWRASTELEIGQPGEAIPWMKRAIDALQRARAAERIYLRGRPPRVVVDLARVRGTGKDESAPGTRSPRPALDPDRALRLTRFDAALEVVTADAGAAADSLLLIRIALPPDERAAARALDVAATALRRGGDVTAPLALARRALAGEPPRRSALSVWGR